MTSTGRKGHVSVSRHWLADPRLSDTDLRLMLWLDSHTDAYLSRLNTTKTAEQIKWSRDRVKRSLDSLTELGLISTEQVKEPGSGSRTDTHITLHQTAWTDNPVPYDEARGATPQGSAVPYDEADPVPYDEARSYSTSNCEKSNREESIVVDDTTLTGAELLCIQMADAIVTWSNDKRPTITKAWVSDMDRLMRLDGRDLYQIERVLKWLYTSPDSVATFWAPNIQSPKKLRAQWIKMAMQYDRIKAPHAHKSDIQNDLDRIRQQDAS